LPCALARLKKRMLPLAVDAISGARIVAATTASADESALRAVADAMRDAAATASDHAAKVRQSASESGPRALEAISRTAYTGAYVLAYGVVYATVFVAQSLPQENPVMRGFSDGGRAAMDELAEG
jgi:hypothetical protein